MKRFLSYSLVAFLLGWFQVEALTPVLPEAPCGNAIDIFGNTNVNRFHLQYETRNSEQVLLNKIDACGDSSLSIHQILLPLRDFNMENDLMKRDFLSLLKADSHPNLILEINQIELSALTLDQPILHINVILAGVVRCLPIPCKPQRCSNGDLFLSGSQFLKLTDFNISPSLYLGLIRIDNDILINFSFRLQRHL